MLTERAVDVAKAVPGFCIARSIKSARVSDGPNGHDLRTTVETPLFDHAEESTIPASLPRVTLLRWEDER
jgi:hypothetical protein